MVQPSSGLVVIGRPSAGTLDLPGSADPGHRGVKMRLPDVMVRRQGSCNHEGHGTNQWQAKFNQSEQCIITLR
jgi:hypothetical protein